jgi:tripartite-type tricarboxylate transporter receptor subunit TctC
MVVALCVTSNATAAQSRDAFPTKPVRLVAGAFGSPSDMLARTLAPKMSETWGQPVLVENRTGGAGTVQANVVAKATPDGHTLLLISAQFAIGAALRPASLPYDPLRDFAGVSQIGQSTSALTVGPSLGVKNIRDFIALAKARPGKLLFSSGGGGSSTHFSAERFNYAAGIHGVHVGMKGTPDALLEVLGGRTNYCLVGLSAGLPFIRDGRLVVLGVSTPTRSPLLPDVPAIVEVLPGFGVDGSHGVMAPARTPMAVRQRVSREISRILNLAEVRSRLQDLAYNIAPSTPEEHDRIIRDDIQSFSEIAKRIRLREK